jgi:cytoskeletal protein RodZ
MKIIISLLTSVFLASWAIAQEESPAPTESTAPTSEEKASATVETTPPEETVAPAAQKKDEPLTTPSPAQPNQRLQRNLPRLHQQLAEKI